MIIVTGAKGFIAKTFVERLEKEGKKVFPDSELIKVEDDNKS